MGQAFCLRRLFSRYAEASCELLIKRMTFDKHAFHVAKIRVNPGGYVTYFLVEKTLELRFLGDTSRHPPNRMSQKLETYIRVDEVKRGQITPGHRTVWNIFETLHDFVRIGLDLDQMINLDGRRVCGNMLRSGCDAMSRNFWKYSISSDSHVEICHDLSNCIKLCSTSNLDKVCNFLKIFRTSGKIQDIIAENLHLLFQIQNPKLWQ